MKFTKLVAAIACLLLAATANAGDGTLRRDLAQNTDESVEQLNTKSKSESVNININTPANQPQIQGQAAQTPGSQAQPVAQPATTVEAQPAEESRAEMLRKERQKAEIGTEQKIVEKLEESRLQEEKARADRLFGNKLDPQPVQPAQQQAAPPPVPAPAVVQDQKRAQPNVTIEKVEIVQPEKEVVKEAPAPAPAIEQAEVKPEQAPPSSTNWYASALIGNLSYDASNVKTNYGLGVAVGALMNDKLGLELQYVYSNSTIADAEQAAVFHTLDQYDLNGVAKYYFLSGKLKPYAGGVVSYITRKYTDRTVYMPQFASTNETTNAVNLGVTGGVDFALSDSFLIGLGATYSFNVMTMGDINYASYGQPAGMQELEKISYWDAMLTGKFLF